MTLSSYHELGAADLDVGEVLPLLDTPGRPWKFRLFEDSVDRTLGVQRREEEMPVKTYSQEQLARRRAAASRRPVVVVERQRRGREGAG